MPTHRSMRGKMIDMTQLAGANQDTVAVTAGGISMNARGDILGPGGTVVKKVEQLQEEYSKQVSKSQQKVSLADSKNMKKFAMKRKFMNPEELQKELKELEKEKEKAKKNADKLIATTEMMGQDEPKIVESPDEGDPVEEKKATKRTPKSRTLVDKEY